MKLIKKPKILQSKLEKEAEGIKGTNVSKNSAIMHGRRVPKLIRDECLFEVFEATAKKFPDNIAIIIENTGITYRDLNVMANRIAHLLREKGVGKEDRVALLMPKAIECYAAIIGIMKAGACYIPLDIGYPEDRINYITHNSGARYVLALDGYSNIGQIENIISISQDKLKQYSGDDIPRSVSGANKDSLAYIIYTSGSTGRPKGVMIEHKSACNLIRASQEIYKVEAEDRVYQGFTLAFDASVEELWMAFLNGAALVPQTDRMKKSGPDLFKILGEYNVSIISCVPTLLSMISDELPSLKLLILGGEACPKSVVERFGKPGRRILNTYGPTEATVIATWSEMKLEEKVTIGKPLSNYSVYVVKENNRVAEIGEPGELLIGGIGLARGYIGRDDLNREKFIENIFDEDPDSPVILYRSGDLVVMDEEGNLEFHGRIDDQIKIRGFRVELSEIENVANSFPDIKTSVVKLNKFSDSSEGLCLYIVIDGDKNGFDREKLFGTMKEKLPAYMMPQHLMLLDEIPMLPSGKADRSKLPEPAGGNFSSQSAGTPPTGETEQKIANILKQVFKIDNISREDHFFNDLGGHSLFAAQTVSWLRKEPEFRGLNISDLYECPSIEMLSAKFGIKSQAEAADCNKNSKSKVGGKKSKSNKNKSAKSIAKKNYNKDKRNMKKSINIYRESSSLAHFICGVFQAISIVLLTFFICIPAGYVIINVLNRSFDVQQTIRVLLVYGLSYIPVTCFASILSKWLIIGRYKEGSYPLWGVYYFRWWLSRLLQGLFPMHLLSGTPLMPLYLRLMGMKVGKDCFIGTHHFGSFDIIQIGDNSSIGQDTQALGYVVECGYLKLGRIEIGKGCYVGTHSTLSINSSMEDGSMIKEQSMIPSRVVIPSGETWAGSPAIPSTADEDILRLQNTVEKAGLSKKIVCGALHILGLMFLGLFNTLIFTQGFAFGYFYFTTPSWMLLISPITATLMVLLLCLEIIIFKRLFMNKIKPGIYSVYSTCYVRKWIADNIVHVSLQFLHTLYATLYTIPFLRALGAKIGKRVEVSTVTHISPELFEVGDGSFFADASMAGTPKAFNNQIIYEKTRVGSRTFIGNSALVPINTTIGDDCLLGVLSVPPEKGRTENGTSWLGTPAMFLHKRDINKDFSDETTYSPGKLLYLKRLMIEFIRVILPTNVYIAATYGLAYLFHYFANNFSFLASIGLITATAVIGEMVLILFVVLLKFSLIGTYKPCVNPLWSDFVWKTEFVTGIYENLLGDYILTPLSGTPMLPVVMRLFGCRIGKKVFLDTIFMSEFDLVRIGNEAAVNFNATMQTHLFEDRVLKMAYLTICRRASVGNGAVVLYDTFMEEGSKLGCSSLLMKGETLEAYTHWHGNPSKFAG
ncbi:MAG TPA: Pls/PosA family non-ribosomal peptide synthetase [Pseudobacteroides sp.]|uniref:Pls/PosA family non-ribosomal peptide synthetase n=1 Tax=Pseudobacteroides sp. TaxID=1968840 RepID=UPI002F91FBD1